MQCPQMKREPINRNARGPKLPPQSRNQAGIVAVVAFIACQPFYHVEKCRWLDRKYGGYGPSLSFLQRRWGAGSPNVLDLRYKSSIAFHGGGGFVMVWFGLHGEAPL